MRIAPSTLDRQAAAALLLDMIARLAVWNPEISTRSASSSSPSSSTRQQKMPLVADDSPQTAVRHQHARMRIQNSRIGTENPEPSTRRRPPLHRQMFPQQPS
jgi:hypothetical protein